MLKSWSIQNFKPILDSGELKLAPVTVLAGRNSSGKSSLIQSILMIAQTLSSRVLDRPLLPHGSFAHLGTFEDILNKYSGIRSLIIGFQLETEKEETIVSARRRLVGQSPYSAGLNVDLIKVTSQFLGAVTNGASSSAIEASKVKIEKVLLEVSSSLNEYYLASPNSEQLAKKGKPFEFSIDIRKLTGGELEDFLSDVAPEYLRLVPYTTKESNYLGLFTPKDQSISKNISDPPDPSLVAFSHFLPTRLIVKFKVKERRRQRLETAISRIFDYPGASFRTSKGVSDLFDPDDLVPINLKKEVLELCNNEKTPEVFSGESFRDLASWFKALRLGRGRKKTTLGLKLQSLVIQSLLDQTEQSHKSDDKGSEALESMINNIYVENLEQAVEQLTRFFTSKIRYLGPLRADPEIIQGFSPSSELDDVGSKGQYAATVYDANQNARIRWYNPISQKIEPSTLKLALDAWTRYLGVAHQIQIEIAGQSGVSWQVVQMEGHRPLPLTAVGVGVSQILPILVMGLLAPSNTLLLVEQPELHLHPSIQARLGDFFMGLAKCGKQCLIETHSENLVNQLRYHIIQAGGQEKSDCLIYFVDQDKSGSAKFESVEISPQGNILNWPEGFFDETILQEGRITIESLRKRAKKANNG